MLCLLSQEELVRKVAGAFMANDVFSMHAMIGYDIADSKRGQSHVVARCRARPLCAACSQEPFLAAAWQATCAEPCARLMGGACFHYIRPVLVTCCCCDISFATAMSAGQPGAPAASKSDSVAELLKAVRGEQAKVHIDLAPRVKVPNICYSACLVHLPSAWFLTGGYFGRTA